jgi:hypothetical protein
MIKAHYIHVWKCCDETPIGNLIYANRRRKTILGTKGGV